MRRKRDAIDELHDELFSDRPADDGEPYERIVALVMQVLAPAANVVHDRVIDAAPPDESSHQIDVVTDLPDAQLSRLLVECRHYNKVLEKRDVMAHWAAAEQIGAHPVVITTKGYRSGAKTYAEDKGMTLLVLRPFREEDRAGRLFELPMEIKFTFRIPTAVLKPVPKEEQRLRDMGLTPPFEVTEPEAVWADESFRGPDGRELEPILPTLQKRGASSDVGVVAIDFDSPRRVDYFGESVAVTGIDWRVEEASTTQRIVAGRGLGEPRLLIVDAVGSGLNRAIFERHLQQLTIASNGQVVERTRLHQLELRLRRGEPDPFESQDRPPATD